MQFIHNIFSQMKFRGSDYPALFTMLNAGAFLAWKEVILFIIALLVGIPTAMIKWIEWQEARDKRRIRKAQEDADNGIESGV